MRKMEKQILFEENYHSLFFKLSFFCLDLPLLKGYRKGISILSF